MNFVMLLRLIRHYQRASVLPINAQVKRLREHIFFGRHAYSNERKIQVVTIADREAMRRQKVISLLCVFVCGFCVNNVYRSYVLDEDSLVRRDHFGFIADAAIREEHMAIEIISGGRNNTLSLNKSALASYFGYDKEVLNELSKNGFLTDQHGHKLVINANIANRHPGTIDTIPGRMGNPNSTTDDVIEWDHPGGSCRLNSSHDDLKVKIIAGVRVVVPVWQRKLIVCGRLGHLSNHTWRFFLTNSLQVRLYDKDRAKWTIAELKQWMHYLFLSGVEHIFLCDHYANETERLEKQLKRYLDAGLVTYLPWAQTRNPMQAQINCYQHIINNYRQHTRWQMAIDMDEYPVSFVDADEGFLKRYLFNVTDKYGSRLTEISMTNYLMLGNGDRKRKTVIDRINRMTPKPANGLVKPIYRPERVRANVHHNRILFGNRITPDPKELRMFHYWGSRVDDFGPDSDNTFSITVEMNYMRSKMAIQLRDSLLAFGEFDAFSNTTGP